MLNDEQVVERVRAGEIGLYELLMRRSNQRVYRVVRSLLINDEDAEDGRWPGCSGRLLSGG